MADDFNGLRIELRKHLGQRSTPLGVITVEHDQWVVIAHTKDGMSTHLGYKNKRPGSPILFLGDLKKEIGADMVQHAEKLAEQEAVKLRGDVVREEVSAGE